MKLHPLAERFADVSDAYERARPRYPPAVAGALAAELGVSTGERVLDLAAGTGKLSRALLGAGYDVVAVEPQESMRAVLTSAIGAERALAGVAEAIPATDGSVAAVTVADGFHWFDPQPALAEIRRVLAPEGGLAVLSTIPDWSAASWATELGERLGRLRPEHPYFDGPSWQDAVHEAGGWSDPRQIRVSSTEPLWPGRVLDYFRSMSWVAAMPERDREEQIAEFAELIDAGESPETMEVHFVVGLTSLLPT